MDANYTGFVVDERLTIGYYTFLGENLVMWRSKKQSLVANMVEDHFGRFEV